MSDPILTTNEVRDGYAMNEFGEVNHHWVADFDRWLAAHDAGVAAKVNPALSLGLKYCLRCGCSTPNGAHFSHCPDAGISGGTQ
jgi:hypothetical protein